MAVVHMDVGPLLAEYPCVTVTQHMGFTASCQFSGGRDVARTFALVAERPGGGHLMGRISLLASLQRRRLALGGWRRIGGQRRNA